MMEMKEAMATSTVVSSSQCQVRLAARQEIVRQVELGATCAGYMGHLFSKSKGCANTMVLIAHLAFTTRCTYQETQEQRS
jgi:hypothetical protein